MEKNLLAMKNKKLKIENLFLLKKIEIISNLVAKSKDKALFAKISEIINDKAEFLTLRQISRKKIIPCSESTLNCFLSRAEFNNFRLDHFFIVNKAFISLLKKMKVKKKKRGKK